MLSPSSRELIHASVPVLRTHGESITRRFYTRLFDAHPDLRNLFNMGNQQSGAQQQSLASALYAYAANIDNQAALAPVVSRIVQKHVSLGVRAEHYPIVGENLLAAIGETLGEAATPELIEAWAEAYGLLADALIREEARVYREKGMQPGEFMPVRVARKHVESRTVTSFYIEALDGGTLPDFQPGQYISVALHVDALGLRQARQYSLSLSSRTDFWRISVKREADGSVSGVLHDAIRPGDILEVSVPCGDFVLDEHPDERLVLIGAGIGITPLLSMLHTSQDRWPQRPITLLYATRDGAHHPMKDEVERLDRANARLDVSVWYEAPRSEDRVGADHSHTGRMDLGHIDQPLLPSDGRYYICGPDVFMLQQRDALLARGIDPQRIQYEVFGPSLIGHLN
jgi:nitric oxide dioxygenase